MDGKKPVAMDRRNIQVHTRSFRKLEEVHNLEEGKFNFKKKEIFLCVCFACMYGYAPREELVPV